MRKKTKMANICRSLRTKNFFSPVLKSPTHVGFTDVKKMGRKSHTWAPLKDDYESRRSLRDDWISLAF
jgi:hypothetical protein